MMYRLCLMLLLITGCSGINYDIHSFSGVKLGLSKNEVEYLLSNNEQPIYIYKVTGKNTQTYYCYGNIGYIVFDKNENVQDVFYNFNEKSQYGHYKINRFKNLKIGMSSTELECALAGLEKTTSTNFENKKTTIYKGHGHTQQDSKGYLEQFSSFKNIYPISYDDSFVDIKKANGYIFSTTKSNKYTLEFQQQENALTQDAHFILLKNKDRIIKLLNSKGYEYTEDEKDAKLKVVIKLTISDPIVSTSTTSSPVYTTNYNPTQTYNTTVYNNRGQQVGRTETTQQATVNTQYVGQNTKTTTVVSYDKTLEFTGIDLTKSKDNIFWATTVMAKDNTDSLIDSFPYLFYMTTLVLKNSINITNYTIPIYHTGIRQLFDEPVPKK